MRVIGQTLGVNFEGGEKKSFNLMTREGRRELRASGSVLQGVGVVVAGCRSWCRGAGWGWR